jgi:hypothetical protein
MHHRLTASARAEDRRRDRELSASSIIGGGRSICSLLGGPVPDAGGGTFCSAAYAIGDKWTISSTVSLAKGSTSHARGRSSGVFQRGTIPCDVALAARARLEAQGH